MIEIFIITDLSIGSEAPAFCIPDQNGEDVCLVDSRGKWVIIYFYPNDNTNVCTLEPSTSP